MYPRVDRIWIRKGGMYPRGIRIYQRGGSDVSERKSLKLF